MSRSILIGILVFLALTTSLPAQVPAPRAVRAVQVAASESGEEAREVVERVDHAGFGPVWVREEGGFVKVLVGRCERLPDAVLLKQALRRHGFADAFERAFPDLVAGDFETEAWTPEPPLLGPPGGASLRVYTENDVRADWRVGEFEEFLRGGQDAEAIVAARRLVAGLSDDDALKGRVMVRAGRAMVRHSRQTGEAVPLLLAVARGEVAATEAPEAKAEPEEATEKLTSSKLAQKLGMKTGELIAKLVDSGYLESREGKHYLTAKGKDAGGEFRLSPKFGPYFLWPESLKP